jgi:threonine dehydrogenase-like Zn-dependent dehydrogenase
MKAACYSKGAEGEKGLVVTEIERPVPGPEEALVRVAAVGICGSDLTLFSSGTLRDGYVMGHEVSGVIEETGTGVKGFSVGDRVVVRPAGCGRCPMCERGQIHLCSAKLAIGTGSLMGGYAEYIRVPERMLMAVPGTVSLRDAALVDTIAVACHGISRADVAPGEDVVVFGAGPIGLSALMVLRGRGAGRLGAVEVNERRRQSALGFGADRVYSPREEGYKQRLRDDFAGLGPDAVLEFAGRAVAVADALDIVRPAGRVALVGVTFEPLTIYPIAITMREVSILPVFSTRPADNTEALDFIRERREEAVRLVSDVIGIDELPAVFSDLVAGALKMKVLIEFFTE